MRNMKDNNKYFYRYQALNGKLEKMWAHCWMAKGCCQWKRKRPRYSVHSSPHSFLLRLVFRSPRPLRPGGEVWSKDLPLVEVDQVGVHLNKLDLHESMGLDWIHSAKGVAHCKATQLSWNGGQCCPDRRCHLQMTAFAVLKAEMEQVALSNLGWPLWDSLIPLSIWVSIHR